MKGNIRRRETLESHAGVDFRAFAEMGKKPSYLEGVLPNGIRFKLHSPL
jgi:hypothetical protein